MEIGLLKDRKVNNKRSRKGNFFSYRNIIKVVSEIHRISRNGRTIVIRTEVIVKASSRIRSIIRKILIIVHDLSQNFGAINENFLITIFSYFYAFFLELFIFIGKNINDLINLKQAN